MCRGMGRFVVLFCVKDRRKTREMGGEVGRGGGGREVGYRGGGEGSGRDWWREMLYV